MYNMGKLKNILLSATLVTGGYLSGFYISNLNRDSQEKRSKGKLNGSLSLKLNQAPLTPVGYVIAKGDDNRDYIIYYDTFNLTATIRESDDMISDNSTLALKR